MSSKKQDPKRLSKKPPSKKSSIKPIDFLSGEVEKKMAEYKRRETKKRSKNLEEDNKEKPKQPQKKQESKSKSKSKSNKRKQSEEDSNQSSEEEVISPGRVTRSQTSACAKKNASGKSFVFHRVIQSLYLGRNHIFTNIFLAIK